MKNHNCTQNSGSVNYNSKGETRFGFNTKHSFTQFKVTAATYGQEFRKSLDEAKYECSYSIQLVLSFGFLHDRKDFNNKPCQN